MTLDVRELLFAGLARLHQGPDRPAAPPLQPPPVRAGRTGRHPAWSQATILAALHAFVTRTGHFPVRRDWQQAGAVGLPARDTARKSFGTVAACEAAYWTYYPREAP